MTAENRLRTTVQKDETQNNRDENDYRAYQLEHL